MTRALDSQALRGADACEEGLSWLEAQGGRLSLEDDGAVEAAVEASPGFAAWAFFHMPALRGALGEARLAALAGPQHAALAALFDALRATPLLGGGAADEVIQVEVEAHLRALARLPLKLGLRAPVPITRVNLYDAWGLCPPAEEGLPPPPQAWIEGWWRAHGDEVTAAPLYRRRRADPRATARAWLWSQVEPIQARAEWVGRFIGAAAFRAAFRGARAALGPGGGARWLTARAIATAARLDAIDEALWCLADVEAENPFTPLRALWRQGVWPAGVAGGAFIIGTIEEDHERSTPPPG